MHHTVERRRAGSLAAACAAALLASVVTPVALADIAPGQLYTLTAKAGNLVLDNRGLTEAGQIGQWSPVDGNSNQQWRLVDAGNGRYMLISLTSGMALDDSGSTDAGAIMTQYDPSAANPNQQWTLSPVGQDTYQLVNVASGKALDNGGGAAAGDPVRQQLPDPANPNQQWRLGAVRIGASTPFVSIEAESGNLLGGASVTTVQGPSTTKFSSAALEASGHAFVHLAATGQQVGWSNDTGHPVTAINIRYSIPDAAGGGGIDSSIDLYVDGVFRQAIPVTSRQTWVYENDANYDGYNQDPSSGHPHVFWDEAHVFVTGAAIAPGSSVILRKDGTNTAAYYDIDVADLETPPPPLQQPAGSISIESCGAVANDIRVDSTKAIQQCIDQAQAVHGTVWVPRGTYYLNTSRGLTATGITIAGAGPWYSTIYANPPLPATEANNVFLPVSVTMRDFAIDSSSVSRPPEGGNGGAINIKGDRWLIDNLWIRHLGAAVWADGTNGIVQNTRINNAWADGINLNNGNGGPNNDTGNNLVARNNFIRGTGDDGIAINDGGTGNPMRDDTVINNTVIAPWWANNIAVYGGYNIVVANNLGTDSVKEHAMSIGVFGSNGPLGSAWIEGNRFERGGGLGYGLQYPAMGVGASGSTSTIANITVRGNTVVDSMFEGVGIYAQTNAWIQNTRVERPGQDGYVVEQNAQGNASLLFNSVSGVPAGRSGFVDRAAGRMTLQGRGNSGFQLP